MGQTEVVESENRRKAGSRGSIRTLFLIGKDTAPAEEAPPVADSLNDIAVKALEREDFAEAMTHLAEVLRREPNNVRGLNNLGVALMRLGRNEEALQCFDRVLAVEPVHAQALGNKADILKDPRGTKPAVVQKEGRNSPLEVPKVSTVRSAVSESHQSDYEAGMSALLELQLLVSS